MTDENDRLIAVIKGSYLARYYPDNWRKQVRRAADEQARAAKTSELVEQLKNRMGCKNPGPKS